VQTHLHLRYAHDDDLPAGFDSEVRTPPALVERFLRAHTEPGDRVLDPFAGAGTTLRVAGDLGRDAVGVEDEDGRCAVARQRAPGADVRKGDALDPPDLPPCDCAFTSPPFMVAGMETNPFRNYAEDSASDYRTYLDDARTAFRAVDDALRPDAPVLVDVSNVNYDGEVTTLAWDLADALRDVFHFEGEHVVAWEGGDDERDGAFGYGYDHSYVLAFRTPA
jgi:DNA modification methylase